MIHKKSLPGVLLLAVTPLSAMASDAVLVPTPRATALAATASSRPFLAAGRSQQVVDLAARGYVEREVTVSGQLGNGQGFVTRLLVRRPLDAGKFSGRVIVELLPASPLQESAPLWGFSWEHFLRRGDAWVGVTVSPAAVEVLKKFNAVRYGALGIEAGEAAGCGVTPQAGSIGDVIAQVGALLRSSSKENPLLGLNPQRLIAAGHGASGDLVAKFATSTHRSLRLGNADPVFDGFLNLSGMAAVSPACVEAQLPRDVPFVSVLSQSELLTEHDAGDAASEGLRVFEIAGTRGAGPLPAGRAQAADLAAAGLKAEQGAACREPVSEQMLVQALNAIWQQMEDLLVLKQPMSSLPQIQWDPRANSRGGWRLPQVDLPVAGLVPGRRLESTQNAAAAKPVCDAVTGSMPRFDVATLKQLYRTRIEYLRQFNAAVDQAVAGRLLTKEDAAALKAAVARTTPAF